MVFIENGKSLILPHGFVDGFTIHLGVAFHDADFPAVDALDAAVVC
jgi:hypothetical protein